MAQAPTGDGAREYEELRVLAAHYGKTLDSGSYGDFLRTIDRLTQLRDKAKKLWGDR